MAKIDDLEIVIKSNAQPAVKALDDLVDRLGRLQTSLSSVQTDGISHLANGINALAQATNNMKSIDPRTFSKIATRINAIANVNTSGIYATASSVMSMAQSFSKLGQYANSYQSITELANSIAKLGYKSVSTAITNIPLLSSAMAQLFQELSTAPQVSRNIIDMTNALANLAAQGRQVGTVSNALTRNYTEQNARTKAVAKSSDSLARSIGLLYAKYFMLFRGIKKLWKSATDYMDFTETVNYFEVAITKIGKSASRNWEQMGYENAESYAESFSTRMRTLNEKMSGFKVDENGNIDISDIYKGLGMNPGTTMQYTAMFSQIADGIGMTEEASIALSEAFVKLGADWSSLRNTDFDTAYNKLASGLSGQSRALRTFGIDITQATLQELAFSIGIEKNVSEMTQAEKSYLRTIAVLRQSRVAYGDLANTIASPANQMRLLNQGLQNTSTLLGSLFMPIVQHSLPVLNGFVIAIQKTIIAISNVLGIKMGDINTSLGGMDDNFADLEEDVDDATDAVNKFVKAVRPIDELNVLNGKKAGGLGGADLDMDNMMKAFYEAIEDYNREWQKAYDRMQNDANAIADNILSKLNVDKFVDNIHDLVFAVKDFDSAIKPFTSGMADGFLRYLDMMGDITFGAFTESLEALAKALGLVNPNALELAGAALGTFIGVLMTVKTASTVVNIGKGIATAIGSIGTMLTSHPILSTFALAAGFISLYNILASRNNYYSENAKEFSDSLGIIKNALFVADSDFQKSKSAANELERLYENWRMIADKTGELTDEEKSLLKVYSDMLIDQIPELNKLLDDEGKAYKGVSEQVDELIKKTLLLYRTQGAENYLGALSEQEIELKLNIEDIDDAIADFQNKTNLGLSEYTKKKMNELGYDILKLGERLQYAQDANARWMLQAQFKLSNEQTNNIIEITSLYQAREEAEKELEKVQDRINKATEEYISLRTEAAKQDEKATDVKSKYTKVLSTEAEIVNSLPEALKKPIDSYKKLDEKVEKLSTDMASSKKKAKDFLDEITGISKLKLPELKLTVTPVLNTNNLPKDMNNILFGNKVQANQLYANGGFPEDGWFRASHGEIMGSFDNGQSVVANNMQITQGIAQAVKSAILEANGMSSGNVVVQIDGKEVFSVVRKEAETYQRRTGQFAF